MCDDVNRRRITPKGTVVAYGLQIYYDKDGYKRAYVEPLKQGDELVEALARDNWCKEYWVYDKKWEAKHQAKQINDMADINKKLRGNGNDSK